MGIAGVVGTLGFSHLLKSWLYSILGTIPLIMALIAVLMITLGTSTVATSILLVGWGLLGTAAPVGWGTWLSRTMADDAEVGGGLQVATIQFAITFGASLGGVVFDSVGWWATSLVAAALLIGSILLAVIAWRTSGRTA